MPHTRDVSAGIDGDDVFEALVRSTSLKTWVATSRAKNNRRHDDEGSMIPTSSSPQTAAGRGRSCRDEDGSNLVASGMPSSPPYRWEDDVRRNANTVDNSVAVASAQTAVDKGNNGGTTTDRDYLRQEEEGKKHQPKHKSYSEFDEIIAGNTSSCARRREESDGGSAAVAVAVAARDNTTLDFEKGSDNHKKNRVVGEGKHTRGTTNNNSKRAVAATSVQKTFRGHTGRERAAAERRKLARRRANDMEYTVERERQTRLKFGRLPRPAVPGTFGF